MKRVKFILKLNLTLEQYFIFAQWMGIRSLTIMPM